MAQVKVDLVFTTDVKEAKKGLQELQKQIDSLSRTRLKQFFGDESSKEITEATLKVKEFQSMMKNAVDSTTGRLDLSKLNASLNAAGTNLKTVGANFAELGTQGVDAFGNVVAQINNASIAMRQTNKLVDKLWASLKNTINWQISTSITRGVVKTFSSAYNYAKDLDKSLNDIRIVTSKSSDEMAKFAVQANKATKALNATTLDYTDAALIYFQQGLDEKEALARTDVTIKMANAAGASAESVSQQLTAIWNNFYDGSKSLEYYADVMTKLGAATATSSDEIAEGLEKFAAVSDTIGLSYEYATAALATVTSNTRESADVVGTSFKTIFSRMQDLELGETLDDGTTLGQYSQAMAKVGIQVLDTNGDLIEMDNILDQMAEKWNVLSSAQKVSLAQSVAGVRQYNQLVALMDNWDAGDTDSMMANLKYTEEALGTLEEQQNIYAESWEAAQNRFKASAQGVYDSLIDKDYFTDLLDTGSDFLSILEKIIDGLGGMKGLIESTVAIFMQLGQKKISNELTRLFGTTQWEKEQETKKTKTQANQILANIASDPKQGDYVNSMAKTYNSINDLQLKMYANQSKLTQEQINTTNAVSKELIELSKVNAKRKENIKEQKKQLFQGLSGQNYSSDYMEKQIAAQTSMVKNIDAMLNGKSSLDVNVLQKAGLIGSSDGDINMVRNINNFKDDPNSLDGESYDWVEINLKNLKGEWEKLKKDFERPISPKIDVSKMRKSINGLQDNVGNLMKTFKGNAVDMETLNAELDKMSDTNPFKLALKSTDEFQAGLRNGRLEAEDLNTMLYNGIGATLKSFGLPDDLTAEFQELIFTSGTTEEALEAINVKLREMGLEIDRQPGKIQTWQEGITAGATAIMQAKSAFTAFEGMFDSFLDSDTSVFEKITSSFSSIAMIILQVIPLINNLQKMNLKETFSNLAVSLSKTSVAWAEQAAATEGATFALKIGTKITKGASAAVAGLGTAIETAFPIIIGVMAIASLFKIIDKIEEKQKEIAKENREKAIETAQANKEEIKSNQELLKSYLELRETYKETGEGKADLAKKSEEVVKALNDEKLGINSLALSYDELTEAIKGAQQAQYDQYVTKSRVETNGYEAEMQTQFINAEVSKTGIEISKKDWDNLILNNSELFNDLLEKNILWKDEELGKYYFSLNNASLAYGSPEDQLILYNQLKNLQSVYADSGKNYGDKVYAELGSFFSQVGESVSNYEASLSNLNQAYFDAAQFRYDNTNSPDKIRTQDDFLNYRGGLIKEVYDEFGVEVDALGQLTKGTEAQKEAADALIKTYLRTNATLNDFNAKLELANSLRDKGKETGIGAYNAIASIIESDDKYNSSIVAEIDWGNDVISPRVNKEYKQKAQSLSQNGLDINNIDDYVYINKGIILNTATHEVLKVSEAVAEYIRVGYQEYIDGLKEKTDQAYYEAAQKLLKNGVVDKSTYSLREKLQSGEVDSSNIAEDEDYKLLLAELDTIKTAYPELTTEADLLSKTWLAGTDDYVQALERVSEQLDKIHITKLNDEAEELREELSGIDVGADPDRFFDVMDGLLEKEYSIDVEIFAHSEDDFKGITNEIDAFEESIGKIGKDYKASWDDIYKLNKALPGIIDNISTATDGSAQLDQQAVESAVNAAKARLQTHIAETVDELEVDATTLEEKAEYYERLAVLARENANLIAEGEEIHANVIGEINYNLGQLKDKNAQIVAEDEIGYQEDVATNAQENAGIMASNWSEAYANAAKASLEFAKVARQNAKAAVDENESLADWDFSISYTGENGVAKELEDVSDLKKEIEDATSAADWNRISQQAAQLAENARKQANWIHGMITQIGGLSDNINYNIAQIGKSTSESAKELVEMAERYHEITRLIELQKRKVEQLSTAMDKAFGSNRLKIMDEYTKELKKQIDLEKQLTEAQLVFIASDRAEVEKYFFNANFNDDTNEINNYTNLLQQAVDEYNAAGADDNAAKKKYQNATEALKQYEETLDKYRDQLKNIEELQYKILSANYEKITYQLELNIDVNELDLKYIEYYLDKIVDDFYAMAEAATTMVSKTSSITNELGAYRDSFYQLTGAYRNAEISQADYIDGLKEAYESILDQLSALTDLDKEMKSYYEDTLDAASEELSKYTDRMEHLTGVLDHYKNLIELINGEYDYKSISKILDGQAKTLKNELDVATEYYQMLLDQRKELEAELLRAGSDAARELIQNELDAINAAVDEAQENMLAKTEEWTEAQKAIMENAMAEAAAEMEKAFTDGMGFDALSNSLNRLSSYADEYLTKTNQMYETQKLINTAQQAADKSTNEAAKVRLKAYTDEIEQLQNKNQLSNLELEIAKAKYDIVLAEIALEEAQNAKSTVRLQRDNEGNFGYVYTADQNAISQAESDLADAQNRLYNIGLEGTNEYGQKLLELQQELSDALVQLEENRAAGQYATDEEYYAAKDQLIQEYNNLFRAYSEQYTTALGVDTAIQEEAWINAYQNMIYKTADWQEATTEYTGLCEDAYKSWRDVVEAESAVVDAILNNLEDEVNDVTEAGDNLRDEVVNEVIPAMEDQLFSVLNVTEAYAAQRDEIFELISYYEALAESIREVIREQSGLGGDDVDFNKDYSLLMNEAVLAGDMVALQQYAELRDKKIAAGYSDYGISTQTLLNWLSKNGGVTGNNLDWQKIIPGLATGGYTGSWGPEGRLALLHEKELVLNADDTNNFLAATSILRDAVKMIELQAIQGQVSTLPYTAIGEITGGNSGVDQNVRIEANFPNVQDRNEIQEAFNNLINTASQYANRK